VYGAWDEFFARARLADDEDAQVEACGNFDVSPDFPHQVRLANKSANYRGAVYAFRSRLSTLSGFWTMTMCLHKVESPSIAAAPSSSRSSLVSATERNAASALGSEIVFSPRFFLACKFQYFCELKGKDFHIIL
jgi:hypothetical protein